MQKLSSANGFGAFLLSGRKNAVLFAFAAVGVLLMMIGSFNFSADKTENHSLEERTAQLCSMVDGVGECSVMITYDDDGDVYAVAVLCEGADSLLVEEKIKSLSSSLFGIGTNRITVLKISK